MTRIRNETRPGQAPGTQSARAPQRVLFVLTSHSTLGRDDGAPTGFHLLEAALPWRVLRDAGFEVRFASPRGGAAPIDPGSLDRGNADNLAFLEDADASRAIRDTEPLERVSASDFAGVFFPGGHGAMWDFPDNPHVNRIVSDVDERGGVIGAVCHGPAALVGVRNFEGIRLVEGRRVAAFTDEEERAVGKADVVPFLLASKLKERGAEHVKADNFQHCVVTDARLVTGQNPASVAGVAEEFLDALAGCSTPAHAARSPGVQ